MCHSSTSYKNILGNNSMQIMLGISTKYIFARLLNRSAQKFINATSSCLSLSFSCFHVASSVRRPLTESWRFSYSEPKWPSLRHVGTSEFQCCTYASCNVVRAKCKLSLERIRSSRPIQHSGKHDVLMYAMMLDATYAVLLGTCLCYGVMQSKLF